MKNSKEKFLKEAERLFYRFKEETGFSIIKMEIKWKEVSPGFPSQKYISNISNIEITVD